MHKIVVLDGYTLNPGDLSWKNFEDMGELTVYDRTAKEDICRRIGDGDIILTNKTPLDGEILRACPAIKYIGCLSTGYNVVDVKTAGELGIVVTNIPSYGTESVAQFTMALLLEIVSRVGMHSEAVRRGQWWESSDFCFWNAPLMELDGKTMGIIGYGAIGRAVAKKAEAFGMKILAYDRMQTEVSLETLFSQSDVISLHCPLTEETRGMINKDTIRLMKDGVILINTARGPLIEEGDLRAALDTGKVGAAGLDVVSEEPIRRDNPLIGAENLWITPHIAWAPLEARSRLMHMAEENVRAFLDGKPVNQVPLF